MTAKKNAVSKATAMSTKEQVAFKSKIATVASVNGAAVMDAYGKSAFGDQDINVLADELSTKIKQVHNGDLQHCESMLVGQAHALQSIFVSLARKAANQEYMKNYEGFLRLALKAQNQSRMTLETLAAIKNPPVVFAKQANINHGSGNQQVNNGVPAPTSRTEEIKNEPNQLLEVDHGSKTLDTRTASRTGLKDKAMATVDA